MLEQELRDLVFSIQQRKCEDNYLEVKAACAGFPKIKNTLSSFSNQNEGGSILFGINEKDYSLCGIYDADSVIKEIDHSCKQMTPTVRAVCTALTINEKVIVCAEIAGLDISQRPCFITTAGKTKGSYIRVGDADNVMTPFELYKYESFQQSKRDELRTDDRLVLDDIKTPKLDVYLATLSTRKPNLAQLDIVQKLRLQGFTNGGEPTVAAAMLFALYPQGFFPKYCIQAVAINGNDLEEPAVSSDRFIDNQNIEGTLSEMLKDAIAFIKRNTKTSTRINPATLEREDKEQYPPLAVREVILNALMHRDYSVYTQNAPITIRIFKNRLEVCNPGSLYGRTSVENLGETALDVRNPYITGAMEVLKEVENRYSGIPTIRKEMAQAGLPNAQFINNRESFMVILSCEETENNNTPANNETIPQHAITKEESLFSRILTFCQEPRTREEIATEFSEITKRYLFAYYIAQLVADKKLELKIPDKPKSKYQMYRSIN